MWWSGTTARCGRQWTGSQLSADVGWPAIPTNELSQVLLRAVNAAAHGITVADARDHYGVVVAADGSIDTAATGELRARRATA